MNRLEEGLVKVASQLGLPKESVKVDNIYGYNWNWKKKKSEEYLATKSFQLKVSDVKSINDLVDKLDPKGINSMNVARLSHSKLEELKYELKAEALKAAKAKAKYLLDAMDEKLGGALEVQEMDYGYPSPVYARSASFDEFESKAAGGYQSQLDFKTITIKAEFRVVFEIE